MRHVSYFALIAALVSHVFACSSESESTPDACQVGEACSCSVDTDCPDPIVEYCSPALACLPRPANPDTGGDEDAVADVADIGSDDVADAGSELIDQIRDTTDEQLIEDNQSSCEERCEYAATCEAPEPFSPTGCQQECDDLNGSIAEAYGDSPEGRACLEGIALLDACLLALDCATFVQVEYGSSEENPCGPVQDSAAGSCNALFGSGEGSGG